MKVGLPLPQQFLKLLLGLRVNYFFETIQKLLKTLCSTKSTFTIDCDILRDMPKAENRFCLCRRESLVKSMDEQPFLQNALDEFIAAGADYPRRLAGLSDSQVGEFGFCFLRSLAHG